MLGRNSVGRLRRIFKSGGEVRVVADVCEALSEFYVTPFPSSEVGIYKFRNWSARDVSLNVENISGKVMILPHKEEMIAFRLLHTC